MVIEVLYKSFRYEKFDSSAQTNSEPFRAKGTNILTDWNLYLGDLKGQGVILVQHWYDGTPPQQGENPALPAGTPALRPTRQTGTRASAAARQCPARAQAGRRAQAP